MRLRRRDLRGHAWVRGLTSDWSRWRRAVVPEFARCVAAQSQCGGPTEACVEDATGAYGRTDVSQTKYVEYGDRGFWAYDVSLGVLLKHVIDVAEHRLSNGADPWISDAVSAWRIAAAVPDIGLTLDRTWSAAQKDTFLGMLQTACRHIEERGSFSAAEIESWPIQDDLRIYPRGALNVLTAPVVEVGHAIGALMIGHLLQPPSRHELVYGAPPV
jgi:hypothetical protein